MTIQVTFASIENAAARVASIDAQIQSELADLKAGVTAIANSWEGDALTGYQAEQARWDRSAEALHQVLQKISSTLQQAAGVYQQTEAANARMWQG